MTTTYSGPVAVAVIFGGVSGEHPISCATAAGVIRAMDPQRYDILPIAITPAGQWVLGPRDPRELEGGDITVRSGEPVGLVQGEDGVQVRVLAGERAGVSLGRVDVVLPLLHGPFGEDGTLQGMLEMLGVPYVGSGVAASAVGMDKHLMKVTLEASGLPVDPYVVVTPGRWDNERSSVLEEVKNLALPLFVKPCRAGSSLGISRVDDLNDLAQAMNVAQKEDPKVIIEAGISGREIECGVLGGRGGARPRVAEPGEVVLDIPRDAFYDYTTKYFGQGAVNNQVPADLPDPVAQRIREQAVIAFEALGCEGLARVDFFYTSDGRVVVNEINTMPGFTPYSMFPVMWQSAGMTYSELVDDLIAQALERPLGLR